MRARGLENSSIASVCEIVCIGAHCDDIDIGCGGAMLALLERNPDAHVTWVVIGSTPVREREFRASARRFLRRAHKAELIVHKFRDGFFPAQYAAIKQMFESLKRLSRTRPHLQSSSHRSASGPPCGSGADLEYFPRSPGSRIRNSQIRGRLTTPSAYVSLTPHRWNERYRSCGIAMRRSAPSAGLRTIPFAQ